MEENLQQPCGCEGELTTEVNDASVGILQQTNECNQPVSELVCVEAEVEVTPTVNTGPVTVTCVRPIVIGRNCSTFGFTRAANNRCTFNVSQLVCVTVPVEVGATARARTLGVFCGPATPGATCPTPPVVPCTRTRIGFIQDAELTLSLLLAQPGDQIVLGGLGTGAGIRVVVTEENIFRVLQGTEMTIPAPLRQLVAQLLAATLNVLNGAGCPAATLAITAANNFLIAGGTPQSDAPTLAANLRLFNRGAVEGCPDRCPGTPDDD